MGPNIFLLTALGAAEHGINNLLELDVASTQRIASLEGKQIELHSTGPEVKIRLTFSSSGIALSQALENDAADTVISGSAADLIGLLTTADKPARLRSGHIQITGDIELSQQLQVLVEEIDIDWEARLADWIGDIPAHLIGNQLRALASWGKQTSGQLNRHINEYLHEEARVTPPAAEIEAFYEEISQLVLDTDRLAARLARLQQAAEAGDDPAPNSGGA